MAARNVKNLIDAYMQTCNNASGMAYNEDKLYIANVGFRGGVDSPGGRISSVKLRAMPPRRRG